MRTAVAAWLAANPDRPFVAPAQGIVADEVGVVRAASNGGGWTTVWARDGALVDGFACGSYPEAVQRAADLGADLRKADPLDKSADDAQDELAEAQAWRRDRRRAIAEHDDANASYPAEVRSQMNDTASTLDFATRAGSIPPSWRKAAAERAITIAVDFDKTLFSGGAGESVGEPLKGAREALEALRDAGCRILIWSARSTSDFAREAMRRALDAHGFVYDAIDDGTTPGKPRVDLFVDDRAVGFRGSWPATLAEIYGRVLSLRSEVAHLKPASGDEIVSKDVGTASMSKAAPTPFEPPMALPPALAMMPEDERESLCINCGLCCMGYAPDRTIVVEAPCRFLEWQEGEDGTAESRCAVYNERHEVAKEWCRPLPVAIAAGVLPGACPYVVDLPGYVGTEAPAEGAGDAPLRALVKAHPVAPPPWMDPKAWRAAVDALDPQS